MRSSGPIVWHWLKARAARPLRAQADHTPECPATRAPLHARSEPPMRQGYCWVSLQYRSQVAQGRQGELAWNVQHWIHSFTALGSHAYASVVSQEVKSDTSAKCKGLERAGQEPATKSVCHTWGKGQGPLLPSLPPLSRTAQTRQRSCPRTAVSGPDPGLLSARHQSLRGKVRVSSARADYLSPRSSPLLGGATER